MINKKTIGYFGEDAAAEYLQNGKYKILARNYFVCHDEIDIIAFDSALKNIVFIEVKTRKGRTHGLASESISKQKLKNIVYAAKQYMFENPTECDVRFDVIEVYYKNDSGILSVVEINHIKNAFYDLSGMID